MLSRIHIYASLLTLANVVLYAVVGIASLADARRAAPEISEVAFAGRAPTDHATAERVVHMLGLSLATPVHDFNIGHDAAGRLVLDFYHANGRHKVTVMEDPPRLRIERTRASLWKYLSTLHVTTAVFRSGDWRMQAWAWWNEFAMWCLAVMTVSGVWIWLRRRGTKGGWRRVHRLTALTMAAAIAVYEISALQMAHRAWFGMGWMVRVHRMRGPLAAIVGCGLLLIAASGLGLWWGLRRERSIGLALAGAGSLIVAGLAAWMRYS